MIITRAAIMFSNGEVVEGYNYSAIASIANKLGFNGEKLYGFVTSDDEFVYPAHAADIALAARQIMEIVDELSPEDLWPESNYDI